MFYSSRDPKRLFLFSSLSAIVVLEMENFPINRVLLGVTSLQVILEGMAC